MANQIFGESLGPRTQRIWIWANAELSGLRWNSLIQVFKPILLWGDLRPNIRRKTNAKCKML